MICPLCNKRERNPNNSFCNACLKKSFTKRLFYLSKKEKQERQQRKKTKPKKMTTSQKEYWREYRLQRQGLSRKYGEGKTTTKKWREAKKK